jgi:ornithine decarboxylase
VVLKLLSVLGTGFDCASMAEIDTILSLGNVDPSRIILAHPCKLASHLKRALDVGVELMTFDNADELQKIARLHPSARCVMRILADDSSSVCRFGCKFGAPKEDHEALLLLARELGVNIVGVSFHVGSGCMSPDAFVDALHRARRVFDQAAKLGQVLSFLDLGGGFPGAVPGPNNVSVVFEEIAEAIAPVLDELFPPESDVEIIAEPGRYFVSECATLATFVISRRVCVTTPDSGDDVPERLVYQNDGVYGSFNCIFFDHCHPLPVVRKTLAENERGFRTTIFGPTCDSMDCITKCMTLPDLVEGDVIYYQSMGAYTKAAGSCFNGMPLPLVFYIFSS